MLNNSPLSCCEPSIYFLNCALGSEEIEEGRVKRRNLSDDGERGVGDGINIVQGESMQGMFQPVCHPLVTGEWVFEKQGGRDMYWGSHAHVPPARNPHYITCLVLLTLFHIWENWGSEKQLRSCNQQEAESGRQFVFLKSVKGKTKITTIWISEFWDCYIFRLIEF